MAVRARPYAALLMPLRQESMCASWLPNVFIWSCAPSKLVQVPMSSCQVLCSDGRARSLTRSMRAMPTDHNYAAPMEKRLCPWASAGLAAPSTAGPSWSSCGIHAAAIYDMLC